MNLLKNMNYAFMTVVPPIIHENVQVLYLMVCLDIFKWLDPQNVGHLLLLWFRIFW